MSGTMTRFAALSAVLFGLVCAGRTVEGRQPPQDLAAKLSGTWVLNRDMSTGFGARAGPRTGRGPAVEAVVRRRRRPTARRRRARRRRRPD